MKDSLALPYSSQLYSCKKSDRSTLANWLKVMKIFQNVKKTKLLI